KVEPVASALIDQVVDGRRDRAPDRCAIGHVCELEYLRLSASRGADGEQIGAGSGDRCRGGRVDASGKVVVKERDGTHEPGQRGRSEVDSDRIAFTELRTHLRVAAAELTAHCLTALRDRAD